MLPVQARMKEDHTNTSRSITRTQRAHGANEVYLIFTLIPMKLASHTRTMNALEVRSEAVGVHPKLTSSARRIVGQLVCAA